MSYGDGTAKGVKPLFGASWKQVLFRLETVKQCMRPLEGQVAAGGWTVFSGKSEFSLASDSSLLRLRAICQAQATGNPAAALYMYSVDSPFVNLVNQYMSTGWAITPPNSESQVTSLLANYSLITNQSVTPNLLTPNMAVNVTFLDQMY